MRRPKQLKTNRAKGENLKFVQLKIVEKLRVRWREQWKPL